MSLDPSHHHSANPRSFTIITGIHVNSSTMAFLHFLLLAMIGLCQGGLAPRDPTGSTTDASALPTPTSAAIPSATSTTAPAASTTAGGNYGGPTSSPLLFFVALGFGVVFTNLW